MSLLHPPDPVKLLSSVISAHRALLDEGILQLAQRHGKPDYISDIMPFNYTDYYTREMGTGLTRRMVSFETLISPSDLPDIKNNTNEIEALHTLDNKRNINIDPGYISAGHLLLATGKPYAHRPYLRDGIYGDITLIYRDLSFQSQEWTYPDYGNPSMIAILTKIREKYLKQLAAMKREAGKSV